MRTDTRDSPRAPSRPCVTPSPTRSGPSWPRWSTAASPASVPLPICPTGCSSRPCSTGPAPASPGATSPRIRRLVGGLQPAPPLDRLRAARQALRGDGRPAGLRGHRPGDDRLDHRAGPPALRRGVQKKGGAAAQAIGRSRGGPSTKIIAVVTDEDTLVAVDLAEGQRNDAVLARRCWPGEGGPGPDRRGAGRQGVRLGRDPGGHPGGA